MHGIFKPNEQNVITDYAERAGGYNCKGLGVFPDGKSPDWESGHLDFRTCFAIN